jgi:hypothetical protein
MILRPDFNRARNKFEPVDGRGDSVRHVETGVAITARSGPDYTKIVTIRVPSGLIFFRSGRVFSTALFIGSKFPDRPFVLNDPSNPTIQILMGALNEVAKQYGGTTNDNTILVYSLLQGLSAINRLSPFSRNPFFYSDRNNYVGREDRFRFILPSEDEIASL